MSEYKEDVYIFFGSYDKFNNIINDQPGPWYFCDIEAIATFNDKRVRNVSAGAFKIAKWWKENKTKDSMIFYQSYNEIKRLIFNEEELANRFKEWFKTQDISGYEDYQLWKSPRLFLKTMENDEELHIEAKVNARTLFYRYDDCILTEEIFDVYCWIENNLDTVYYETRVLYFKRKKDAVAFKIKWMNDYHNSNLQIFYLG